MATINILQKQLSYQRVYSKATKRPGIITNLIIRMGLGLFMAVLPLLFFRFMVNWFATAQTGAFSQEWQVLQAGHISWAFIATMFASVRIALIIRFVSSKRAWLKKYGRLVGRICTVGSTGLSVIAPYMVFTSAQDSFFIPTFLLACFIPVMTFIVIGSASKDYLLRMRIWFDKN